LKSLVAIESFAKIMSIPEALNESVEAIRTLLDLQTQIEAGAELLRSALLSGHKVLSCGNGGSAADSSHLASEFACRFISDRRPYPAIGLAADGSLLTATANDYSFEEVFARQIRAFGQPGDVLVAITTSGQSRNVERALEQAKNSGLQSIALLGRDGGTCRGLGTVEILVPHQVTARIQEAHKVVIHLLCELVEPYLLKE
jgi:D-sedoheptulose 7-phosphate isomerase